MAWWMYIQCHVVGVVHNVMTPTHTHTAELPFDPLRYNGMSCIITCMPRRCNCNHGHQLALGTDSYVHVHVNWMS